jgi:hypothetical protein
MSIQLEHSRAIICEGVADQAFFMRLIHDRGLPGFDILDAKGRTRYSEILKGLRVGSHPIKLKAVLIVADNDDVPTQSFAKIQKQIRIATGYPVPGRPMEIAKTAGQPLVLIMMLPWTDTPGCLETLLNMIWQREQESMKVCVDEFLTCTKVTEWKIQKRDKAAIQCFIAGSNREDPNKSLRYFLELPNNPLPMNAPELDKIADTLKNFDILCGL